MYIYICVYIYIYIYININISNCFSNELLNLHKQVFMNSPCSGLRISLQWVRPRLAPVHEWLTVHERSLNCSCTHTKKIAYLKHNSKDRFQNISRMAAADKNNGIAASGDRQSNGAAAGAIFFSGKRGGFELYCSSRRVSSSLIIFLNMSEPTSALLRLFM